MIEMSLPESLFIVKFTGMAFDKIIIFILSVLMAVTVNAEAQAFMATVLGDIDNKSGQRFHFNPLLHLSLSGVLCFIATGFGWSRHVKVNRSRLAYPGLQTLMIRCAGPLSNLILAGIAGSIVWIMAKWQIQDQVFSMVVEINLMMVVYNILPLPPLAGAAILGAAVPNGVAASRVSERILQVIPFLTAAFFITLRLQDIHVFQDYLDPAVRFLYAFITRP